MFYNTKELISVSQIPRSTFFRRLNEIKEKKLFEKKTLGAAYTFDEALIISSLIGFSNQFTEYAKKKIPKSTK